MKKTGGPDLRIGFEQDANALGALYRRRQRLARRLEGCPATSMAVRKFLNAIDLHAEERCVATADLGKIRFERPTLNTEGFVQRIAQ
ncbi:MAG TPA: hypothetical protein VFF79_12885 [Conexibacter sp.]|nr:hypothetical protein [Conexibacter sp.]